MRTLDECKTAIRRLSAEDRAQLVLWLSHGMPAGEKQAAEPAPRRIPLEESQRLAMEGLRRHIHMTEPAPRRQIKLNDPPPLPPDIDQ